MFTRGKELVSVRCKELVQINEKDRQSKRNLGKEYKQFQEETRKEKEALCKLCVDKYVLAG